MLRSGSKQQVKRNTESPGALNEGTKEIVEDDYGLNTAPTTKNSQKRELLLSPSSTRQTAPVLFSPVNHEETFSKPPSPKTKETTTTITLRPSYENTLQ
jgi:hypothetical protein